MPKQRRHHNNDGRAMIGNGKVYQQNKKIAEKLQVPFGKETWKKSDKIQK